MDKKKKFKIIGIIAILLILVAGIFGYQDNLHPKLELKNNTLTVEYGDDVNSLLKDCIDTSIYENKDFRPLGTTYNSALTYEEFMQTNQSLYELNNIVICNNENLEEIKALVKRDTKSELNNIQYGGNQLTGDIKSDNGGFMVITLPYDEGWKILVNENEVKKYEVNGGFIGIPINQGENHIEMYFVPKGFKFGLIMSVIGSIMATVLFIFSIKERKKSSI